MVYIFQDFWFLAVAVNLSYKNTREDRVSKRGTGAPFCKKSGEFDEDKKIFAKNRQSYKIYRIIYWEILIICGETKICLPQFLLFPLQNLYAGRETLCS